MSHENDIRNKPGTNQINNTKKISQNSTQNQRQNITPQPQDQTQTAGYSAAAKQNLNISNTKTPLKIPQEPENKNSPFLELLIGKSNIEYCKLCKEEVTKKCEGITCDRCDCWWHASCAELTEWEYSFFNDKPSEDSIRNIKWICKICKEEEPEDIKAFDLISKLVTRMDRQERTNQVLQQGLAAVLDYMKEGSQKEVQTQVCLEEKVQTTLKEVLDNNKEKEEKETNAILFNVPEVSEGAEKKTEEEKKEEDFLTVNSIIQDVEGDQFTEMVDPASITRLGKIRPGSKRPRPIKVQFDSKEEKWFFLRNAHRLKKSKTESHQKVVIKADKTKAEMNADRKLIAECLRRREETKDDWIIFAEQIMLRKDVEPFKEERMRRREAEREEYENSDTETQ